MIIPSTRLLVLALSFARGPGDVGMFRGDAAHTGRYLGGAPVIAGVQWRVPTDGDVTATPLVQGDVVFIGSGSGKLFAIDRTRGIVRWTYQSPSPVQSSAAGARGLVVFGTRDGLIHALEARSGAARWTLRTGRVRPWPWGHESGDLWTSSPTIADGTVFIGGGDGLVYAVELTTGRVVWKAPTEGRIRGSPAVADGLAVVGATDGRVYAFDAHTGARRWRFETLGAHLESKNFGFDRRTVQSSPAIVDGVVYVGARDGFLYAIDARTGARRWAFDHKVSWVNSSPAVVDGTVYVGSSDGHFLQAVDAATGQERWRANGTSTVWASPAVTDRYVYWSEGNGRVHVSNRASGAELSSFFTGAQAHSSPVVDGDLLFVGSSDGGVYALRLEDSTAAVKRFAFFDSTYLRISQIAISRDLATYLGERGYTVAAVDSLASFLERRIADRTPSVVVFAIDAAPTRVLEPSPRTSLFRRYLDSGGKIVWAGLPPAIWPVDPLRGERRGLNELQWNVPETLLGVSHAEATFDARSARPTASGVRWGLPAVWRTAWSVGGGDVTDVLARDDWGLAAAWVKRFGGPDGTGFVRIPATTPLTVYLAAEYRPR